MFSPLKALVHLDLLFVPAPRLEIILIHTIHRAKKKTFYGFSDLTELLRRNLLEMLDLKRIKLLTPFRNKIDN